MVRRSFSAGENAAARHTRIKRQAAGAYRPDGVSLSAYVRTKIFGGRPLIPRTDECTIRELRRMGGLLKHHFSTMREANVSEDFLRLHENLLQAIRQKIDAIGIANHDREEDQV